MADVKEILTERGTKYGNYLNQTMITARIQDAYKEHDSGTKFYSMKTDQQDALEMIAVKISRILNGDPDYSDNWHDIAGYATLVADRLDGNERE